MYSENRREYEKKVMQIVEERSVSDFIPYDFVSQRKSETQQSWNDPQ